MGPAGISHYKGEVGGDVSRTGQLSTKVSVSAGDKFKVTRLYVGVAGTNRVEAVDSKRWLGGLETVGHVTLAAPARYIGTDYTRVYVATDNTLVVLASNSFEGFSGGVIPVVDTIDFRANLPSKLHNAPVSGLAVGPHRVYLTFKGAPYVVSIAEPAL